MFLRFLYHELRYTLTGKSLIVLTLVALPSLFKLATEGRFSDISPGAGIADGVLVVVHFSLSVTFAVYLVPLFAKAFVLQREDEPLLAHPFALPALARHRLVATLLMASGELLALYYVFFGRVVINRLDHPWFGVPVHVITSLAFLFILGIGVGVVFRAWMLRATDVFRRARTALGLGGALSFLALAGLILAIGSVVQRVPAQLGVLGDVAVHTLYFGLAPVAVTLAADAGQPLVVFGWVVGMAVVGFLAIHAVVLWSEVAHLELPLDLETPTRGYYRPLFGGFGSDTAVWPAVRPFWRKDVVAPYAREPRGYFSEQWFVFFTEVGAVVLIAVLRHRGALQPEHTAALLVVLLLGVVAGLAMLRGLNCLGLEGSQLGVLRPVLAGGQLFVRKGLANGIYVLTHAVAHALVLFTAAQIAGLGQITLVAVLGYAIGGALIWTFAASALGFLLPDLQRRATFLSGATTMAKFLYVGTCSMALSLVGVAHVQYDLGRMDGASYAGFITFVVLTLVATFSAVTWWALHRFPRIEL